MRHVIYFLTKDQAQFNSASGRIFKGIKEDYRPKCIRLTTPVTARIIADDSKVMILQDAWQAENFDDIVDVLEERGLVSPLLPTPIKLRMTI